MCPAPSPTPLRALGPGCSEKDIVLHLDKFMCGSRVPDTVLDCVNPYQNQPQRLPPDIWYLVNSTGPKETEDGGFWAVKGDACEIFENPDIKGWRTNLEFFKGRAPYGLKTEWVMQEYSITRKGAHKDTQKSRVLCRIIKASGSFSNLVLSVVPNTTSTSGRGSSTESQTKSNTVSTRLPEVHRTESLFVESKSDYVSSDDFMELNDLEGDIGQSPETCRVEHPSDQDVLYDGFLELADLDKDISKSPVVEKPENPLDVDLADTILRGDYLELNDLAELASHSSSSANSSHRKSDEFFGLLLDDEKSQDLQAKGSGFHCNYMGSGRPNEVILPPTTSELMITGTGTNEPQVQTRPTSSTKSKSSDKALKDPNVKRPKPESRNEDSSNASSSRHRKKKFKKYFCFFPF
ncbi:PREDICTED: NAC domain-containing protein 101-like isoform X2 [Ipomoea nil]|uniref:NAC domain-containing protein 101-like isoform X2 n=1 Tax=Ipomoea nil TaxID=35883 RepID=UPI000900865F|nr:PREDICTED: NAC domain-containing protein 101-like isoform X2 [Ipomoea nil]